MKLDQREIIDISPLVHEGLAVFPGDTSFERHEILAFKKGDHLGLSWMKSTPHLGAHADAPNHYMADGVGIEARSLSPYLGLAQVISVSLPRGERVRPHHLPSQKIQAPRVLFKTRSYLNPDCWQNDFVALSAELIDFLAARNVVLVGIDTPSIDPAEDAILESHKAVARHDLAILEGVILESAEDGLYDLVALPLKIKNADATPVRAILLR